MQNPSGPVDPHSDDRSPALDRLQRLRRAHRGGPRAIAICCACAWACARAVLPGMIAARHGVILNIASTHAFTIIPETFPYPVVKHALLGLTRAAALDHAADKIRVNAVGPAFIHTPLVEAALDAETRKALEGMHALKRMGTPEEVSSLVCYLLSDRAAFVTGSYHLVDGGYTAQ